MNKPSDNIIKKVFDGLATTEEAKKTAEWFATDEGQTYLSMEMDYQFLNLKTGYEEVAVDHEIPSERIFKEIQKYIYRIRIRRLVFRTVAILIPFVFIISGFWILNSAVNLFGETEYAELYVPKGDRIQMIFQDGTHAYINSDTRLRYPKKFGLFDRKIFLEGEAYFIVEKNKKRPFVVQMKEAAVNVYGTSFNIKAYPESNTINVALDKGEISLTPRSKQDYFLKPGGKLTYDKKTGECTIYRDEYNPLVSLWTKDILAFKNTPLVDVIKDLNRWYNVDFEVKDSEAYAYSYTLISENTSLDVTLSYLERISPVKFTRENNKVIITIKK